MLRTHEGAGKMSNFAAVATIIGGNLGTGTIAGTALAVTTGGPGAIFWMVLVAFLCSVIKLVCSSLGVYYHESQNHGRSIGGPMFYILRGLFAPRLAILYCIFLLGASLTVGNLVQVNSFISPFESNPTIKHILVLLLTLPVAMILYGGLKRFASFMSCIVPLMGLFYIGACLLGLVALHQEIPSAIATIFQNAFGLNPILGAGSGIVLGRAIQHGISRGLFATDIGLGLAAIAHSSVDGHNLPLTQHAREQGYIALVAPIFVALLCACTGLLILCAHPDLTRSSSEICIETFVRAFHSPYAGWIIPIVIYCFALTTILAWAWFAEHTFYFVKKAHLCRYFKFIVVVMIPIGASIQGRLAWTIADVCIDGLLIINLLALFRLRKKVFEIEQK